MRDLPSGTVSFLFTDVERSTKLLRDLGAEEYTRVLAAHRRVLREAFAANQGVEVDTQGDGFFVAFPTAPGALGAAAKALEGLGQGPIRVRMGIHTGTPHLGEEGYVGVDVHRAARIAAAGHGGQVLVSASTAALVGTDGLRDLGEHRLKDFEQPVRLFQLGEGEFPTLKSLNQSNLPIPQTPFVGRERELAELSDLLSREDLRLLTLTGPGGTGKTRLAAEAASEAIERFPDGLWWVPLAALREPELVRETIAHELGARDDLAEHVGGKRMLLLLDNFEQVLAAASLVAELAGSCPNLRLLVTSRETLRLAGEREYPVPPLAEADAVTLFRERALALRPDLSPNGEVEAICRRLDCLPLAVELAAVRVRVLSPRQILDRLEQRLPLLTGGAHDFPERQQTLRAAIAWSHELLTPDEQAVFRRLAVFSGGCTLDAAEDVCDGDIDLLQSLVEKSLLRHRDERFTMLETIREYALEQLEEAGEDDEIRRRHAYWYLAFAEQHLPLTVILPAKEHVSTVARELDNVRSALAALADVDPDAELRLAACTGDVWNRRSYLREGMDRLEGALARASATEPRPRAHGWAAAFATGLGDVDRVERHARKQLDLGRDRDALSEVRDALVSLGRAAQMRGNLSEARRFYEEATAAARDAGDAEGLQWVLLNLGDLALTERDFEAAATLSAQAIEAGRTANIHFEAIAFCLGNMALARLCQGRVPEAAAALDEALASTIDADAPMPQLCAALLASAGGVLEAAGHPREAAAAMGGAEVVRAEISAPWPQFEAQLFTAVEERLRTALGAGYVAAQAEGESRSLEEALATAHEALTLALCPRPAR
jgi:predicted ATPase